MTCDLTGYIKEGINEFPSDGGKGNLRIQCKNEEGTTENLNIPDIIVDKTAPKLGKIETYNYDVTTCETTGGIRDFGVKPFKITDSGHLDPTLSCEVTFLKQTGEEKLWKKGKEEKIEGWTEKNGIKEKKVTGGKDNGGWWWRMPEFVSHSIGLNDECSNEEPSTENIENIRVNCSSRHYTREKKVFHPITCAGEVEWDNRRVFLEKKPPDDYGDYKECTTDEDVPYIDNDDQEEGQLPIYLLPPDSSTATNWVADLASYCFSTANPGDTEGADDSADCYFFSPELVEGATSGLKEKISGPHDKDDMFLYGAPYARGSGVKSIWYRDAQYPWQNDILITDVDDDEKDVGWLRGGPLDCWEEHQAPVVGNGEECG